MSMSISYKGNHYTSNTSEWTIYIYIYIEREREREMSSCMIQYIYIYIYILVHAEWHLGFWMVTSILLNFAVGKNIFHSVLISSFLYFKDYIIQLLVFTNYKLLKPYSKFCARWANLEVNRLYRIEVRCPFIKELFWVRYWPEFEGEARVLEP